MQLMLRQRGISLIEVLVAVVVFSVGILALALLQAKGAQFTKESGSRTAAIIQARSLADAMRANPAGARPGGSIDNSYYLYDGSTSYSKADCESTDVSTTKKIATRDLACWSRHVAAAIPTPAGGVKLATVAKDAALGTLTIRIAWAGVQSNAAATDVNQSYSFTYLP